MRDSIDPNDILQYNAAHRVLICRECKYAIQKSAIESHLLRHKIYRGHRQRLLAHISRLDVLEPEHVQIPSATSSPIDGLAVIDGHRCTFDRCDALCASEKRMRRHWNVTHGRNVASGDDFAVQVRLQTFFRGTKLRYFEVASESHQDVLPIDSPQAVPDVQALPRPAVIKDTDSLANDVLDKLRYFHHFTMAIGLLLPIAGRNPGEYWQKEVVSEALQLPWLMCGLLSLSSSHSTSFFKQDNVKRRENVFLEAFTRDFHYGYDAAKRNSALLQHATPSLKMGAQISAMLFCRQWSSFTHIPNPEGGNSLSIRSSADLMQFLLVLQGCHDPHYAYESIFGSFPADRANNEQRNPNDQTEVDFESRAPAYVQERLRSLPWRMAQALPKPDSAQDFFCTMAALNALPKCFALSYANEDRDAAWDGMTKWIRGLSSRFVEMVREQPPSPGALVVVAHWALLLERVESRCWFLKGATARLMGLIGERLPQDDAIQYLIAGLPTVSGDVRNRVA